MMTTTTIKTKAIDGVVVEKEPVKLAIALDTSVVVYDGHVHSTKNVYKRVYQYAQTVKWSNVFLLALLHALSVVGMWYLFTHDVKFFTLLFAGAIGLFSGMGMSIFAHRYCAHRSFKATVPLQILLAILQAMTMNGSSYSYARDHRTHHKYSDTAGDPKNPSRGLFYSHVGWWLLKKTETVKEHGRKLNFEDLKENWVIWYQHKFYTPLFAVFGLAVPTLVPYYGWGENPWVAFYLCAILRTTVVLHHLFTVNSLGKSLSHFLNTHSLTHSFLLLLAHFFGHRPYDFRIRPTENRLVIYLSLGEGNHNFHHKFPYDYSSSEKKAYEFFNPSTLFIDIFARLGLAYDRKRASAAAIKGMVERHGVPAYFDPVLSLPVRILCGLLDWVLGLVCTMWLLYPIVLFKYLTHQPVFIF